MKNAFQNYYIKRKSDYRKKAEENIGNRQIRDVKKETINKKYLKMSGMF
jgi:hypothetical protein